MLCSEETDADASPAAMTWFSRARLPPAPDHEQLRPEGQCPPGRIRNVRHAAVSTDDQPLYLPSQQKGHFRENTNDEARKRVTEAHGA
eukprot:6056044-Pyramimonas_sp.AAC.1